MRAFSSLMLVSYVLVLGLNFPLNSSGRPLEKQNVGAESAPKELKDLTVDLTLENLGEKYEPIPSNKPHGSRSVLQLTLKVGIRLQDTSAEHAIELDPSCFRVVKRSVFREPLVGPIGESGDIFAEPQRPPFDVCDLEPHPKVVRVMPDKSYEVTEQLKFKVIDSPAVDLSESINPGVYYLQYTITLARRWDMGKQVLPASPWDTSPMDTALLKFTVVDRSKRRQT